MGKFEHVHREVGLADALTVDKDETGQALDAGHLLTDRAVEGRGT